MPRISVIVFLIISTKSYAFDIEQLSCTDAFCEKYVEEKGCPPLSDACRAQNSTHNGIYLPYPDFCNCCELCLENIAEGDPCARGSPGLPIPNEICGPGLACRENEKGSATCQRMDTSCTQAQDNWDQRRKDGTLGMTEVRPECDDDGRFAPVHCIAGSICYCVSPNGKRIFGEIPYLTSWDENKMTCGCSVNNWKARNTIDPIFLYEMLTARCNEYGLYDPLQCMMGKNASCLCVDRFDGQPIRDTTVPLSKLKPGSPPCFNPSIHSVGVYETECEKVKRKYIEETTAAMTTTTQASFRITSQFSKPECQPDGKYHRVQTYRNKKICVDPDGQRIEKYETTVDSLASLNMDCNCARTRWLLSKAGVVELPECCSQGNFRSWQCRRNECFCVDNNGDQVGVEKKEASMLPCYNDNRPCPEFSPRP